MKYGSFFSLLMIKLEVTIYKQGRNKSSRDLFRSSRVHVLIGVARLTHITDDLFRRLARLDISAFQLQNLVFRVTLLSNLLFYARSRRGYFSSRVFRIDVLSVELIGLKSNTMIIRQYFPLIYD